MVASNDKCNSPKKLPLSTEGNFHLPDETTLAQGRINYISAISLSYNEENREYQHKKAPESREETQGLIAYHKQKVCITLRACRQAYQLPQACEKVWLASLQSRGSCCQCRQIPYRQTYVGEKVPSP